jgi:hypothetical protein
MPSRGKNRREEFVPATLRLTVLMVMTVGPLHIVISPESRPSWLLGATADAVSVGGIATFNLLRSLHRSH